VRGIAQPVERAKRGESGYSRCERSDGAEIFWDNGRGSIVVVKDGKIVTFFVPDSGEQYFLDECAK
jgi:hypothetical protein